MIYADLNSFLTEYKALFLTLHILFMAIGLGGATVSDLLFFKFLKDYRISKKEEEVLHLLKNIILTAMVIITVSGIALYLPEAQRLNASPLFLVKAVATAILLCNGIALHAFIAPHLLHLNLREHKRMGRQWHRLAFALGAVSICSWYSVFLIAMLKEEMPFNFMTGVGVYVLLLITSVIGSQIVEEIMTRKAKQL